MNNLKWCIKASIDCFKSCLFGGDILPSTVNSNVDELLSRAQNQLSNTTSNILANSTGRLIPRPVEGFGLPNPVRNTNSPNFDPVDGTSLTGGDTQITL